MPLRPTLLLSACAALVLTPPQAHPQPLRITLDRAARAVNVSRSEERVASEGSPMRYRYELRYLDWDGSMGDVRYFYSQHAYAQAYACGETLVLSNNGQEATPPALALVRNGTAQQEYELTEAGENGREKRWHLQQSWSGDADGNVHLELGINAHVNGLCWYYNAGADSASFYDARQDKPTPAQSSRSLVSPMELSIWAGGSSGSMRPYSLPETATILPCTHDHAAQALRVARQELTPAEGEPRYRYVVQSFCWDSVSDAPPLHFESERRYAFAYACGNLLLLSNSGEPDEDDNMHLAAFNLQTQQGLEDALLFTPELEGVETKQASVCWDGVDEEGQFCGRVYGYCIWHRLEGIEGSPWGIKLRLGADVPSASRVSWHYDAHSNSCQLRQRRLFTLQGSNPEHSSRTLRLEFLP